MTKKLLTILTIASIITSCSSVPKKVTDYKSKKIDYTKQAEFFGNMKIVYDGSKYSDKCTLNFKDSNGTHYVPIDKEGNFKAHANAGEVSLKSVTCYETGALSSSDTHYIEKKKLSFNLKSGKKTTFIGEMEINWKPGGINPLVTVVGLLVGWIAVHRSGTDVQFENKSLNNRTIASTNLKYHTSLLRITN